MVKLKSSWMIQRLAVCFLGTALGGCNGASDLSPGPDEEASEPQSPSAAVAKQTDVDIPSRYRQSFEEATRSEPPPDSQRPPDRTLTGQSVGKLYKEVVQRWNTIRLVSEKGKLLAYTATLETELGPIEISLLPELAPNHVRNFLALASVGYYDGLVFQRTVRQKAAGFPDLELLEAGCPVGTGEVGCGSIGYWLKPEFNDEPHVEGTVGACRGQAPDTAACKFYITLSKAPFLDRNFTVFGKVTQGLDVARKILTLPVRHDAEYPEGDRPEKPIVIRKVRIQIRETTNDAPAN